MFIKEHELTAQDAVFFGCQRQETLGKGLILCPEIGPLNASPVQNLEVQK